MLKKLDYYFLSDNEDEITAHDRLWFYGTNLLLLIGIIFILIALVKGVY